jgi:putative hydrolase of the HAD superfamily
MQALLLDADGVVLKKGELFSEQFAREYNVPLEKVIPFFKNELGRCQKGETDLKEVLEPYLKEWKWQGTVDDFLEYWFTGVQINPEIIELVAESKEKGIACYLASNNEKYRARWIEEKLGDFLDGYFFSADLQVKKESAEFFKLVSQKIGVAPQEIGFVDNEEKNVDSAKEIGIEARVYSHEALKEMVWKGGVSEFKKII